MKPLALQSIARWAACGFAVALALGWPSPTWRAHTSEQLCAMVNPLLEPLTFGQGGHARLRPRAVSEVRLPGENVTSDAALLLRVEGYQGEMAFGVSLRRDFYLPLSIALAALLTAPLPLRRRSLALLVGIALACAGCFASLCITSSWMFARLPAGNAFSAQKRMLLDAVVGSLIMPPGMHFFVPVLIAAASVWSFAAREKVPTPLARADSTI